MSMFLHHRISFLMAAYKAGDDHFPALHPHPRIGAGNKVRRTPSAEAVPQVPRDRDALAHGDLAGERHISVCTGGVGRKCLPGEVKEACDPLFCNPFRA